MRKSNHVSAIDSHYDKEASHYDSFNEEQSKTINTTLERLFKKHRVNSIIDLSCGTGSQVFWLLQKDFDIVGYDISPAMIDIAQTKANQLSIPAPFNIGDMRTAQAGTFDAAITIFNAVGHLTTSDFEKTIQNIHTNLKIGGLYVFDIFNLTYLLKDDNITKLTIDWLKTYNGQTVREIQYSTITPDGILTSYDIYHEEKSGGNPTISHATQTLQIYTAQQLQEMLARYGFTVLEQCAPDGTPMHQTQTERIVTVAQKIG